MFEILFFSKKNYCVGPDNYKTVRVYERAGQSLLLAGRVSAAVCSFAHLWCFYCQQQFKFFLLNSCDC